MNAPQCVLRAQMPGKTPRVNRSFLVVCAVLFTPASALAQPPVWTVDDAVEQALAPTAYGTIRDSNLAGVRADLAARTATPNPSVSVDYEQIPARPGSRELAVSLEQEFDLSGWRGGLRNSLADREAAERAQTAAWELELVTQVRRQFYSVLHRERRVAAMVAWVRRLNDGADAIAARLARGDVSGYDLKRIQRERDIAAAELASEWSQLEEAWAGLQSWIPWTQRPKLEGTLRPPRPNEVLVTNPELDRLGAMGRANQAELDAWGSPALRGWSLGAGYRNIEEDSVTGHGFLVTLTVPLALWNGNQAERDALQAQRRRIAAELELTTARKAREQSVAERRLGLALDALDALPSDDSGELVKMARAAYDAGETSLPDLLDAHEAETRLALAQADLEWEARSASIQLAHSRGQGATR